ncbi:MAG: hypothetical protein IPI33_08485 [Dehalococcoidia bacterium]|jgi:hypothetical protein|uniref:hypothetical protein n=1 Tax=Candidatus Amarobacter glycogenicus TaxID=3140699 RepID=UPI001DC27E62|nr:hypothetical protein [Dehalococcoidia bacterium]MBK7126615.1 hypothetical protein [Dehalococcoidia bacterium]MBK7329258.1 hypothetical protein [Dehalococcoidia bacterium]MBK7725264.1 hypothetical protein [Dehalococcoidia bacterium]MBK8561682.1 hypothetical protein [Dehalococcoidia bacterium]
MSEEVPVGRLVSIIVSVLAAALLLSLAGLVVLGALEGNAEVATTLTHVIETLLGVFVGIAAGRLASDE